MRFKIDYTVEAEVEYTEEEIRSKLLDEFGLPLSLEQATPEDIKQVIENDIISASPEYYVIVNSIEKISD